MFVIFTCNEANTLIIIVYVYLSSFNYCLIIIANYNGLVIQYLVMKSFGSIMQIAGNNFSIFFFILNCYSRKDRLLYKADRDVCGDSLKTRWSETIIINMWCLSPSTYAARPYIIFLLTSLWYTFLILFFFFF